MSEPQAPPPPPAPPAAAPPAKKKVSPWVWVLGGCLVLVLLGLLLMGSCAWFVADKAKDVAKEFEANPAKAAAEMAVRLNPDLEIVASDEGSGTITVRQKSTGEEMTFDFDEIAEGRFSFETEEGESTISFDADSEGGLTIEGPGGETTTFGSAAGDELPSWVPGYPGASEPEGTYSSTTGGGRSGAATFRTGDPVARVLEFYERTLKAAGMEVSKTTFTAQGAEGGSLNATSKDPKRSLTLMVGDEDGQTVVAVQYNEAGGS